MFNFNNNKNKDELQKKPANPVGINNNEYEEEYEFIQVNVATGDQYRKFANIRSKNGRITPEMVNNFHDESTKEAQQWKKNNPEVRSITFRDIRDESGKQVIKVLPTELIFPSGQRVRIYDENGNQIVGEENIRKEIEKREANWEQWEKEGKLKVVDHRTHDFDDGSIATVYSRIAPVKLHENEANEVANHLGHVGKRLKIFGEESKGIGEYDKLVGNSQIKGRIVEVGDDNNMNIDQPETSTNKSQEISPMGTGRNPKINWEDSDNRGNSELPSDIDERLLTDEQLKELNEKQIISLINQLTEELNKRKNEQSSSSVQTSIYKLENNLAKAENALKSFQTSNTTANNDDKSSNVGGVMAVVGVVSVLAIGGIALAKSKFKNSKKK